ncbi:hypothetical protein KY339_04365, partial [Candidatus Woesearchaeota archaeon]|nr:hypothetical protein [Candidatus Woesearchaeota archaeon]
MQRISELKQLRNIGLTDGEAKVYLTLLNLGQSKKTELAKKSGVSSSKIYEVTDRLIKKGLASFTIKNNVKYFQAAKPEKLKQYLQMKKIEIEKEEKIVNEIIPSLNIINQTKESESTTKIYEGYEGKKTIFTELLQEISNEDVYLGMGIRSSKDPVYNRLFTHWHKQRAKKGVKARL